MVVFSGKDSYSRALARLEGERQGLLSEAAETVSEELGFFIEDYPFHEGEFEADVSRIDRQIETKGLDGNYGLFANVAGTVFNYAEQYVNVFLTMGFVSNLRDSDFETEIGLEMGEIAEDIATLPYSSNPPDCLRNAFRKMKKKEISGYLPDGSSLEISGPDHLAYLLENAAVNFPSLLPSVCDQVRKGLAGKKDTELDKYFGKLSSLAICASSADAECPADSRERLFRKASQKILACGAAKYAGEPDPAAEAERELAAFYGFQK